MKTKMVTKGITEKQEMYVLFSYSLIVYIFWPKYPTVSLPQNNIIYCQNKSRESGRFKKERFQETQLNSNVTLKTKRDKVTKSGSV